MDAQYNFCRTLDDIVDEDTALEIRKDEFRNFKLCFKDKDYSNLIIKNIWTLIEREKFSKK